MAITHDSIKALFTGGAATSTSTVDAVKNTSRSLSELVKVTAENSKETKDLLRAQLKQLKRISGESGGFDLSDALNARSLFRSFKAFLGKTSLGRAFGRFKTGLTVGVKSLFQHTGSAVRALIKNAGRVISRALPAGGKLLGKATPLIARFLSKSGAMVGAVGRMIGRVAAKLAWPITVLFAMYDFIEGARNADEILGRKTDVLGEISAGLGNAVSNVTFGITDDIAKAFGFKNTADYYDRTGIQVIRLATGFAADAGILVGQSIRSASSWLKDTIVEVATTNWVKKGYETLVDLYNDPVNKLANMAKTVLHTAFDFSTLIDGKVNQITDYLGSFFGDVVDWFTGKETTEDEVRSDRPATISSHAGLGSAIQSVLESHTEPHLLATREGLDKFTTTVVEAITGNQKRFIKEQSESFKTKRAGEGMVPKSFLDMLDKAGGVGAATAGASLGGGGGSYGGSSSGGGYSGSGGSGSTGAPVGPNPDSSTVTPNQTVFKQPAAPAPTNYPNVKTSNPSTPRTQAVPPTPAATGYPNVKTSNPASKQAAQMFAPTGYGNVKTSNPYQAPNATDGGMPSPRASGFPSVRTYDPVARRFTESSPIITPAAPAPMVTSSELASVAQPAMPAALAAKMQASAALNTPKGSGVTYKGPSKDVDEVMNYFLGKGASPETAEALTANFMQESGLNPKAYNPGENAHGIGQWRNDRLSNLNKFSADKGLDPRDRKTQLDFAWHELSTTKYRGVSKVGPGEKSTFQQLQDAKDAGERESILRKKYEVGMFDPVYGKHLNTIRSGKLENNTPPSLASSDPSMFRTEPVDISKMGLTPEVKKIAGPAANSAIVEQAQGEVAATRKRPVSPEIENILKYAASKNGYNARVISGGQAAKGTGGPRTGSVRHDNGQAGDTKFWRIDPNTGKRHYLDMDNPQDQKVMANIVRDAASAGATGIGGGRNYMGTDTLHIGKGKEATWASGAGKKYVPAPEWLQNAHAEGRRLAKENPNLLSDWVKNGSEQSKVIKSADRLPNMGVTSASASSAPTSGTVEFAEATARDLPANHPLAKRPKFNSGGVPLASNASMESQWGRASTPDPMALESIDNDPSKQNMTVEAAQPPAPNDASNGAVAPTNTVHEGVGTGIEIKQIPVIPPYEDAIHNSSGMG